MTTDDEINENAQRKAGKGRSVLPIRQDTQGQIKTDVIMVQYLDMVANPIW